MIALLVIISLVPHASAGGSGPFKPGSSEMVAGVVDRVVAGAAILFVILSAACFALSYPVLLSELSRA